MRTGIITLLPFAASGLLLIAAMTSPAIAGSDREFGRTVQQNIEIQVVDMDPKYAGTLMEGGVGRRSASAVSRYMKDQIRPLTQLDGRTEVGSQGGSSAVTSSTNTSTGGN